MSDSTEAGFLPPRFLQASLAQKDWSLKLFYLKKIKREPLEDIQFDVLGRVKSEEFCNITLLPGSKRGF